MLDYTCGPSCQKHCTAILSRARAGNFTKTYIVRRRWPTASRSTTTLSPWAHPRASRTADAGSTSCAPGSASNALQESCVGRRRIGNWPTHRQWDPTTTHWRKRIGAAREPPTVNPMDPMDPMGDIKIYSKNRRHVAQRLGFQQASDMEINPLEK